MQNSIVTWVKESLAGNSRGGGEEELERGSRNESPVKNRNYNMKGRVSK